MHAIRYLHEGAVHDGALTDDGVVLTRPAPAGSPRLDGLVTGLFTDHHVHLQLVDRAPLGDSRLGSVMDLGANPDWIRGVAGEEAGRVAVRYAGPFVTASGGYPSDRDWAPEGSVREVADAEAAAAAVEDLAAAGASFIKVVMNSDAGPVLADDAFRAAADAAAAHGIPLVAHAEGAGQARRAVRLGADRLAHSPFSERLSDDEIAAQAASVEWISTLAIHEGEQRRNAIDNVRRFHAAGGTVLYGSDMGNGDTPVDLRDSEIAALREAGVDGVPLLAALRPLSPLTDGAPLLLLPDDDPVRARRLTPADLEA